MYLSIYISNYIIDLNSSVASIKHLKTCVRPPRGVFRETGNAGEHDTSRLIGTRY